MNKKKKTKVYIAIFGLAIAALMIDQVFLAPEDGIPQEAVAGAAAQYAATPAPESSSQSQSLETATSEEVLADRLDDVYATRGRRPEPLRDVFVPAESWRGQAETKKSPAEILASPEEQFRKTHHLQAIAGSGTDGSIVVSDGVGDYVVKFGQKLNGFTLVQIDKDQASTTWRRGSKRVLLKIPDPK